MVINSVFFTRRVIKLLRTAVFRLAIGARGRRNGFSGNKASEANAESDEDHSKRFREHVIAAIIVQGVGARVVRLKA